MFRGTRTVEAEEIVELFNQTSTVMTEEETGKMYVIRNAEVFDYKLIERMLNEIYRSTTGLTPNIVGISTLIEIESVNNVF